MKIIKNEKIEGNIMKRLRTKRISALSLVAPSILSLPTVPQVHWSYRGFIGPNAGLLDLTQVHWNYRGFIGPTAGSLDLPQVH